MYLATDLDGTFLGGRQHDRLALYAALRNDPDAHVVFVTGRGIESIIPLIADAIVPTPIYVIADVGATIVHGDTLEAVQPLQSAIDSRWIGSELVKERLDGIDGLTLQAVPQERRCSYFITDPALIAVARQRLAGLDYELLYSAGRYLDVLPAGVSKGSTLQALVRHLDIDDDSVLVAGDTLNDLSLYEGPFAGVVVGNAEPGLKDAVPPSAGVLHASRRGAGGIIEAMRNEPRWGVIADDSLVNDDTGDAQLVVVYHRLPFHEQEIDGRRVRAPHASPNGIIPTLLGSFSGGRSGSWVAWSLRREGAPAFTRHEMVDPRAYPALMTASVPLLAADVQRFYHRFSKEAFWPVIFSFVDKATFRQDDWEHYLDINRRFAEQAAEEADWQATVWIHDYNLWMAPGFLRQLRPDVRIGFFHHTSFPPPCGFNVIPWADKIVASLIQCDHVGFHIPRYAANFAEVVKSHVPAEVGATAACAPRFRVRGSALAVPEMPTELVIGERRVRLGAHPVGVDITAIGGILAGDEAQEKVAEIRRRFADQTIILSVERLDYVKGPLNKLESFERLLDANPDLRERVVLILVNTPPAEGMAVYDEIRESVDQAAGRINGRFRTLDWAPVHYVFRSMPFEEAVCYYAAADVMWITPLRDGLNLVAKEFVAAQEAVDGNGALVLSEFAGAAVELYGALTTNPYDETNLTEILRQALTLSEDERRERMRRLGRIVASYDVHEWSRDVLRAISPASHRPE